MGCEEIGVARKGWTRRRKRRAVVERSVPRTVLLLLLLLLWLVVVEGTESHSRNVRSLVFSFLSASQSSCSGALFLDRVCASSIQFPTDQLLLWQV